MHKLKPVTPGAGRNKGVAHSGLLLSDDRQAIERSQNDPVLKLKRTQNQELLRQSRPSRLPRQPIPSIEGVSCVGIDDDEQRA